MVVLAVLIVLGVLSVDAEAQTGAAPASSQFAFVGGAYHTQACHWPGCRPEQGDYVSAAPLLIVGIGRYPDGRRLGVSGELMIAGTISGAELTYKKPPRDAAHQNTFVGVMFRYPYVRSAPLLVEAMAGPGLVLSRIERTPVCYSQAGRVPCGPERQDARRWTTARLAASGGLDIQARVGAMRIGPMLRVGYVAGKYDNDGTTADMSAGPFVYTAAVGARFEF